jgi:hypothetical protein
VATSLEDAKRAFLQLGKDFRTRAREISDLRFRWKAPNKFSIVRPGHKWLSLSFNHIPNTRRIVYTTVFRPNANTSAHIKPHEQSFGSYKVRLKDGNYLFCGRSVEHSSRDVADGLMQMFPPRR